MTCPTNSDIAHFLTELKTTHNLSENTIKAYGADLRHYKAWYQAGVPWSTNPGPTHYMAEMMDELSANTIHRRTVTLRKFWKWAYDEEVLGGFKLPKPAKPRPNPLPDLGDSVKEVINLAKGEGDWEMALLLAYMGTMGLRISEARSVVSDDFLGDDFIRVHGKGRKERDVPLSPAVQEILTVRADDPTVTLTDRWARRKVKKYLTQVTGDESFSAHDLRATAATNWLENGTTIRTVQELLGHEDVRTTQVYTGVSNAAMKKAVGL